MSISSSDGSGGKCQRPRRDTTDFTDKTKAQLQSTLGRCRTPSKQAKPVPSAKSVVPPQPSPRTPIEKAPNRGTKLPTEGQTPCREKLPTEGQTPCREGEPKRPKGQCHHSPNCRLSLTVLPARTNRGTDPLSDRARRQPRAPNRGAPNRGTDPLSAGRRARIEGQTPCLGPLRIEGQTPCLGPLVFAKS